MQKRADLNVVCIEKLILMTRMLTQLAAARLTTSAVSTGNTLIAQRRIVRLVSNLVYLGMCKCSTR